MDQMVCKGVNCSENCSTTDIVVVDLTETRQQGIYNKSLLFTDGSIPGV